MMHFSSQKQLPDPHLERLLDGANEHLDGADEGPASFTAAVGYAFQS